MSRSNLFDWCVVHDSLASGHPAQCFRVAIGHGDGLSCRFELMRLVPADALVIEEDANE